MSGGPLPWALPQVLPGDDSDTGTPVPETDVRAEGLALIIRQYTESPLLLSLIGSYLNRIQELEDATAACLETLLDIENATGANLERIGRIVREPKKGRPDYRYRSAIRARIRANRSQGRAEDLLEITRLVEEFASDLTATVRIQDVQPGSVELRIERAKINDPHDVDQIIRDGKAAGVRLTTIHTPYPFAPDRLFRLGRAADYPEKNETTGLSRDADRTFGGALAFALS